MPGSLEVSNAAQAAAGSRPPVAPWIRRWRHRRQAHLAACFVTIAVSIVAVAFFGQNGSTGNVIWISNGILLAYLLLAPRWLWPAYLCAGVAGLVAGSWLIHESWPTNFFFNFLDLIEVLGSAWVLRGKATHLPHFTSLKYLCRFLAIAVFGAPFLAVTAGTLIRVGCWHGAPVVHLVEWFNSDSLGIALTCPIFVAMMRSRRTPTRRQARDWFSLIFLIAVTLGVFLQARLPVMFLIYPFLIVVLLRLGLGWACASSLFVAFASGWCTLHGSGPLAMVPMSNAHRALLLQLFVTAAVFMLYSVSVVLESRLFIERRLARIASLHELVSQNSRDAIILSDLDGNRSYVSAAMERLTGWPVEEFVRLPSLSLLHPQDLPAARNVIRALRSGDEGATLECRMRTRAGSYLWIEASLRLVRHARSGSPIGILYIVRDISERKVADAARAFQHSVLRAIHEVSPEGILVVNRQARIVSYNRRFSEIWRLDSAAFPPALDDQCEPLPDQSLLAEVAARVKDPDRFLSTVRALYANPDAIDQCEIQLQDGRTLERYTSSVQSAAGRYLGRVWFFRDVTANRVAQQDLENAYSAVEALASTDPLTGLANRRRFDQYLQTEWRRGLRDRTPISLLMIDVDQFKSFNDNYGHPRGDSCLKQVAEAAQDIVCRPGDLVARFGGEEFAIILPNTGATGAVQLAQDICASMRRRQLPHRGSPLAIVTLSIGCATIVPAFGLHAVNLIETADKALYLAKNHGRNQVCTADSLTQDPFIQQTLFPTGTA